jgi:serine/threonine-protein kinase HipA
MKVIQVHYAKAQSNTMLVGRLAMSGNTAQFEYDTDFIASGIELSPFKLPLKTGLIESKRDPFNGLHGLFNDSLPDGWGLYLMDKVFRQNAGKLGMPKIEDVSPIDRLSFIGSRAMGALEYKPDEGAWLDNDSNRIDLANMCREAVEIYQGNEKEILKQMAVHGTPSGGARPKMLIGRKDGEIFTGSADLPDDFEHWLVKFPTATHSKAMSEGVLEYIYAKRSESAGIDIPLVDLVGINDEQSLFMVKRFDRVNSGKVHMHSLAGLLGANFRVPDCDYETLLRATLQLTNSHSQCKEQVKRMVFNVMAGNKDDHTKNFSFLLDDDNQWSVSPSYDVTFNEGIRGHHSMSVKGESKDVGLQSLIDVASIVSISKKDVIEIVEQTTETLFDINKEMMDRGIDVELSKQVQSHINSSIDTLMPTIFPSSAMQHQPKKSET